MLRLQVMLVIPRPRGYGMVSDVAERTVALLAKQACKARLAVGAHTIQSVGIAMPKRVPREIDRACLTRLEKLGEGAFGEVCLYSVHEEKRHIPPYMVAAKTIKPGATFGRDELLKEAALMALLRHRNVLGLVGIVTVPRDLPAMILLPYCEGKELFTHVLEAGPGGLTTTRRLTIAGQIALGMQYITTRKIVHRDLAARNVLLDSTGISKVADFGMSASLVQRGKTYAAAYVRMHEEVALRWAAPEALQHEKFSPASDVWAFGVTVWEVFSPGLAPYNDLGNGEVGAHVKSGGVLAAPLDECTAAVYNECMLPCWAQNPSDRPSFGDCYDAAIRNGGLEDALLLEDKMRNADSRAKERAVVLTRA